MTNPLKDSTGCVIAFGVVMGSLIALNCIYYMFFVPRVILTYYCYVRDTVDKGNTVESKEDVEKALDD
ncbi:hypothetical protein PRIPAC_89137 [Pristionchus pacificus]|uniref:Uncharacterized protein n=1 Tax=Pristionchus pacificus TaxID=54126 RepID=A0A454XJM7_PRIPA|nr:hypothetical protein PRIPAC_89137 [Pristionchus pacificus]|eukprot:PDM61539.1 hypothetical protein PRIPAC_50981 [Pristionchus pacificus]